MAVQFCRDEGLDVQCHGEVGELRAKDALAEHMRYEAGEPRRNTLTNETWLGSLESITVH